jgi:hypothetical protein
MAAPDGEDVRLVRVQMARVEVIRKWGRGHDIGISTGEIVVYRYARRFACRSRDRD